MLHVKRDIIVDFPTPWAPKHPTTKKSCWSYKNSRGYSQSCIFSSINFTQLVISRQVGNTVRTAINYKSINIIVLKIDI